MSPYQKIIPTLTICFAICCHRPSSAQQREQAPGRSPPQGELSQSMERRQVDGIENFFQVSDRVYSGGEPTAAGLEHLQQLGVKLVLSVDGLEPDHAAAEKRGMKYIHIPMGYAGIDPKQLQDFVTLMAHFDGKMFVHCHHGKHRGPAAVAACLIIAQKMTREEGMQFMRQAGTGQHYHGLWKSIAEMDVKDYRPQDFSTLFVRPKEKSLAQWMAELDRAWEMVQPEPENPTAPLAQTQLLIIAEAFRESARVVHIGRENQYGNPERKERLKDWLTDCEQRTAAIAKLTQSQAHEKARDSLKTLAEQCVSCHQEYRN